jgi:hypothetical protein
MAVFSAVCAHRSYPNAVLKRLGAESKGCEKGWWGGREGRPRWGVLFWEGVGHSVW